MNNDENISENIDDTENLNEKKYIDYGLGQHPWLRFWARVFDFMAVQIVMGIIINNIGISFTKTQSEFCILLGSIILALLLDGICLSKFSTTPFKWALGIRVTKTDESHLSLTESLKRNIWLNIYSLFFMPLVNLFGAMVSYQYLMTRGTTKWDERINSKITYENLTSGKIIFLAAFILIYSLMKYLAIA